MSDESFLERLRALHSFPGEFEFKVIGENSPRFEAEVRATAEAHANGSTVHVGRRTSKGGRHQSLTLRFQLERAEEVLEVYEALRTIAGVKFLL